MDLFRASLIEQRIGNTLHVMVMMLARCGAVERTDDYQGAVTMDPLLDHVFDLERRRHVAVTNRQGNFALKRGESGAQTIDASGGA